MIAFLCYLEQPLLKNKIGIITDSEYLESPVYLEKNALDIIEDIEAPGADNDIKVQVIQYNANSVRLRVKIEQAGVLIYTDTRDEGWHAKVNEISVPVLRVFKILKGVELAPGDHEIEFYFNNWILISFLAMNGIFLVVLFFTSCEFLLTLRPTGKSQSS